MGEVGGSHRWEVAVIHLVLLAIGYYLILYSFNAFKLFLPY